MSKQISFFDFNIIEIDKNLETPIYKQIYNLIRKNILDGKLKANYRLPSTRELANFLNISRNTINLAFEQLISEGYLMTKIGSGTYISNIIPEDLMKVEKIRTIETKQKNNNFSNRGNLILSSTVQPKYSSNKIIPFKHGLPSLEDFPLHIWKKIFNKTVNSLSSNLLSYGDPQGYYPLRESILNYLRLSRGINCNINQIIIVNGSQQAIDICSRVLLDSEESAWIENPSYLGARGAISASGIKLEPIPLDVNGLNIDYAKKFSSNSKMVYITPSYQFPTGVVMSLKRRLELIDWAKQYNSWILEDDYDSEFRYTSKPLPSLQSLDKNSRVINIGSFSKILFPALRLGYMVVPIELIDVFVRAKELTDRGNSIIEQIVLTDFINEDHLARHIRKMRTLYFERQNILVDEIQNKCNKFIDIENSDSGMSLVGWLKNETNDIELSNYLFQKNIFTSAISNYYLKGTEKQNINPGLVFGYTGFKPELIKESVDLLSKSLINFYKKK